MKSAGLAELADALALGASGRKAVQVQVLCPAPSRKMRCLQFAYSNFLDSPT